MNSMNADVTMQALSDMQSPLLNVHPQRCILVRNRNASCLKCAEVCTTGAISRSEDGIVVDPGLCIGCGTCATACPTCCLEAINPTDDELSHRVAEAVANTRRVAFACETALSSLDQNQPTQLWKLEDETGIIPIACLGRIDESILVEAAARGAESVSLISASCQTCAHSHGGELCDQVCHSASALLHAAKSHTTIERVHVKDTQILPAESNAGTPSPTPKTQPEQPNDKRRLAPVQSDGTLPHHLPSRRKRLFNSLRQLGASSSNPVGSRLWGSVDIDVDLCRSCRMCTVFCPTGALSRFDSKDGTFGVEHRPTLCVQCRACETICPEHAISVSESVDLDSFLTGKKRHFVMKPLDWNPSSPDAIATRMARFIKTDTFQDPQGKLKPNEIAEKRQYAIEREHRRESIRSEKTSRQDPNS